MSNSWWSRLWRASPRDPFPPSVTDEIARTILSAAPALYKTLEENLGGHRIKVEWFVEFASEVSCYILHLLDRTLSDVASARTRMQLMDELVLAICRQHRTILGQIGFDITNDQVKGSLETCTPLAKSNMGTFDQIGLNRSHFVSVDTRPMRWKYLKKPGPR